MSLTLRVDGERWRAHLRRTAQATPGMAPVIKGNGYGFTAGRLARRATWLGLDTICVGTYNDLPQVVTRFPGDIVVMTPWRSGMEPLAPKMRGRVIHTVSRPCDLGALRAVQPDARFVLERVTSMRRHGMSARELWGMREQVRGSYAPAHEGLEGVALHLPLPQGSHLAEASRLLNDVVAADLGTTTVWVSHLSPDELASLRSTYPDFTLRPRTGTSLWLGDRESMRVTSTVLDVHQVERGDAFGYRSRTVPKDGHLLIVSGGTAHGIGLEAPTGESSLRSRAATVARGGLDAVGFVRSPFSIDGKQRLFAEPPHMQASMLFLPQGAPVPHVGDEIDVRVRYTATDVDEVVIAG